MGLEIVSWFSAGVTSTVATKLALESYKNVRVCYFDTGAAHPDNERFIRECEKWFGKKIEVFKSKKFDSPLDVARKKKWINGVGGARCTLELKKNLRFKIEKESAIDGQVFGFEYSKKEVNRAIRFMEQYPDAKPIFPLIERKLTKKACMAIMERAGIKKPTMYSLGYKNNNCIGCFKGGMGYWNKIRVDFPQVFKDTANMEKEIGASCMRGLYLDDLPIGAGHRQKEIMADCDSFCDLELKNLKVYDLDEAIEIFNKK
tara:strand:- start:1451 stop:2227 length:777 start_codon:yes stop_codon:yes gene_type:complete